MKEKLLMLAYVVVFSFVEKSSAMKSIDAHSTHNFVEKSLVKDTAETFVKSSCDTNFLSNLEEKESKQGVRNQLFSSYSEEKIIKEIINQLTEKEDPIAARLLSLYKEEEIEKLLIKELSNKVVLSSETCALLQKNFRKKFLDNIKNSLVLAKKGRRHVRTMHNLSELLKINRLTLAKIESEREFLYDEEKKILSKLEEIRNRKDMLNYNESLELKFRSNFLYELSQKKEKVIETICSLKKIRREKYDSYIALRAYEYIKEKKQILSTKK